MPSAAAGAAAAAHAVARTKRTARGRERRAERDRAAARAHSSGAATDVQVELPGGDGRASLRQACVATPPDDRVSRLERPDHRDPLSARGSRHAGQAGAGLDRPAGCGLEHRARGAAVRAAGPRPPRRSSRRGAPSADRRRAPRPALGGSSGPSSPRSGARSRTRRTPMGAPRSAPPSPTMRAALLLAGHHGALDGLGLVALLGAALGAPVTSSVRGIGPDPARTVAPPGDRARLREAVFTPPARVVPARRDRGGDRLVAAPAAGLAGGTATLAAAGMRAVRRWNQAHGDDPAAGGGGRRIPPWRRPPGADPRGGLAAPLTDHGRRRLRPDRAGARPARARRAAARRFPGRWGRPCD